MRVLVIGAGMFGSAAARHLARCTEVLLVGPNEPPIPDVHPGPFASHYDEGRIVAEFSTDPIWVDLVRRSLGGMAALGADLVEPCGVLTAVPAADCGLLQAASALRDWLGLDIGEVEPQAFPALRFRPDERLLLERAAGYFSPRRYVALAIADARRHGAAVHEGVVRALSPTGDGVRVELTDGEIVTGSAAVVTAGAYAAELLPVRPSWRVKSEITVLGELAPGAPVPPLPCVLREPQDHHVGQQYVLPPIRYPDGRTYLKCGANTLADRFLNSASEIDAWYREGDSDGQLGVLQQAVMSLVGELPVVSWRTRRCVESYTSHGRPYVGTAGADNLFVAAGGNGHSAMVADAIGQLVAGLVVGERWPSDLPAEAFALVPEGASWAGAQLLRDRRGGH